MNLRRRMLSTLAYLLFFMAAGLMFHEAGHALAVSLLGGTYAISYDFTWGIPYEGVTTYVGLDPGEPRIADFAGGLYAAALLAVPWYWAWRSKTLFDTNLEFATAVAIGMQLSYGLAEGVFNDDLTPILIISGLGAVGVMAGSARRLFKFWSQAA